MRVIRNRKTKYIFILCLIVLGIVFSQFSDFNLVYLVPSKEEQGNIIKVYDGDTLTILHNGEKIKVRLYGIDAPESNQNYGKEATSHLLTLCPIGSNATLKIKDKDKYNRIVGIVFCNGIDVNANQVENGLAWAYKEYSLAYVHLEIQARLAHKGLWSEENPIKPSIYRKQISQYKEWANAHIPRDEIR